MSDTFASNATAQNDGFSFKQWLRNHSYAILLAVIVLAANWGVMQFRIGDFEIHMEELDRTVARNTATIQAIQIQAAGDASQTKEAIKNIEKTQERILDMLERIANKQGP